MNGDQQKENTQTQEVKLDVYVETEDGTPLKDVKVEVTGKGYSVSSYTGSNGYANPKVPFEDNTDISLTKTGYETHKEAINLSIAQNRKNVFRLTKESAEVEVLESADKAGLTGILTALGGGTGIAAIIGGTATIIALVFNALNPNAEPQPNVSRPSNSPSITTTNPTGESFVVRAIANEGVPFTNPQDKITDVRFRASGLWTTSPNNPEWENFTSPAGYSFRFKGGLCPEQASALVVKNQRGDCIYVGEERTLTLSPNETIHFYINDTVGGYSNNQGSVEVEWDIVN